jgi:hypothetical protein
MVIAADTFLQEGNTWENNWMAWASAEIGLDVVGISSLADNCTVAISEKVALSLAIKMQTRVYYGGSGQI